MGTTRELSCHYDGKEKEFAETLYRFLFFNIFSLDELYQIIAESRLIKWKTCNKGTKIFCEGEYDQNFYIVMNGSIDIFRKFEDEGVDHKIGKISEGEVFGEMVVSAPELPRRASAYVCQQESATLCEINAVLVETCTPIMRAKFMKKFLDLIIYRLPNKTKKITFYEKYIKEGYEKNHQQTNEYFAYCVNTATTESIRLTQYIKFTDFIASHKVPPEKSILLLESLLSEATEELQKTFSTSST